MLWRCFHATFCGNVVATFCNFPGLRCSNIIWQRFHNFPSMLWQRSCNFPGLRRSNIISLKVVETLLQPHIAAWDIVYIQNRALFSVILLYTRQCITLYIAYIYVSCYIISALSELFDTRPMIISRSTAPGDGQYGGRWLGDNSAKWLDMRLSVIGKVDFIS